MSDLKEVADGYRVTIRRSKTDQAGEGAEIVIPRGLKIRPVQHIQTWLLRRYDRGALTTCRVRQVGSCCLGPSAVQIDFAA